MGRLLEELANLTRRQTAWKRCPVNPDGEGITASKEGAA